MSAPSVPDGALCRNTHKLDVAIRAAQAGATTSLLEVEQVDELVQRWRRQTSTLRDLAGERRMKVSTLSPQLMMWDETCFGEEQPTVVLNLRVNEADELCAWVERRAIAGKDIEHNGVLTMRLPEYSPVARGGR